MKKRKSFVRRAAMSFTAAVVILSVSATPMVSQLATRGVVTEADRDGSRSATDDVLPSGKRSDGCTLIPDGDFRDCCVAHDREYFYGGTVKERRAADERLYQCIRKKKGNGHKFIAPFIWFGVRVGGVSFFPTSFRWGFGKTKKKVDNPPQSTDKSL